MITVDMRDPYFERASHLLKPFPLLILFYLLPEELVQELKLTAVPRCPLEFVADEFFAARYFGKAFRKRLMKLWAKFIWESTIIKGFVGDYSADDPMHILAHDPDICLKALASMGYDTDWLATKSVTEMVKPYPNVEESAEGLARLVYCFWMHPEIKASEIYEIVRTRRAHEDYSFRESNAKIDFYRSYNHTQSKTKMVPYNGGEHDTSSTKYLDVNLQNVDIHDNWNSLFARLRGKHDETIFKMTYLGYTQKQIADYVGYADQGAVSKRLKYIWAEYRKQREQDNNPPPSKKPSTVKYDVIPFSYKRTAV